MGKLICVFSTLASPVTYTRWERGANNHPVAKASVTIKGGAGVANSHVQTPRGVATLITPEQLAILKADKTCQLHMRNGHITIDENVERPPTPDDAENAAANMEGRDVSAPLVPQDYSDKDRPVVGGETGSAQTAAKASGPGTAGRGRNRR